MRHWWSIAGCALLWARLTLACTPESVPTQLLVVVDSDLMLDADGADALRTIDVTVLTADGDAQLLPPRQFTVSANPTREGEYRLPLSFALLPRESADGTPFRVVVTGQNGRGDDIAERQVVTAFRAGASLRLDLFLATRCLRKLCREDDQRTGFTCDIGSGSCDVTPESYALPIASNSPVSGYERPQLGVGSGSEDAGPREVCRTHTDCDDGFHCNGVETCEARSAAANAFGCVQGMAPLCAALETCDENTDRCSPCTLIPDGDRDGVRAIACGGSDCNDGDPSIAPGLPEICDGKDNDCDQRSDATSNGSVCTGTMPIDAGGDSGSSGTDAGTASSGTRDGGSEAEAGSSQMDSGAARDASGSGGSDAAMEASAPDANVPLTSRCTMGSTAACSSFVNAWDVEVPMGPYGAVMERNVGVGFATPSEGNESLICQSFVAGFDLLPSFVEKLNDVTALNVTLYTVYRPVNWPLTRVPIVTWGNGTCLQPEGYGALLRYIASHGFLVVAPNNRFVGDGAAQKKALDFAFAANMNAMSPYYKKLDTTKVMAMGHSQGGLGTTAASSDPRINAAILFNGGTSASKPFFALSGDRDLDFGAGSSASAMGAAVTGSSQPQVAWMWMHKVPGTGASAGHLTLIAQPERVAPAAVAWSKFILLGDAESKTYFAGASCKLCNMTEDFEFGQKGIQ